MGITKELIINDGNISTILTMPVEPMKIFFQIQLCKATNNPIEYNLINAYTKEQLNTGDIYFHDPYGIYYISFVHLMN